jgi:hypothetical protein
MKGKQGWGNTIRCEESSPLYWEVFHEMQEDKQYNMRTDTMIAPMDPQLEKDIMSGKTVFKDTNVKKRGRFSNKTK